MATAAVVAGESPPPGLQCSPAVAGMDGLLYAVWSDGRDGGSSRLYWTRFEVPVSDTLASPVTGGGASELRPAVAAGSGWALVAWEAWDGGLSALHAAELTATGAPTPVPSTAVTSGEGQVWRAAVAIREDVGILVWEDERDAPGDLYLCRWRRGLGPQDPGGTPFAVGPEDQRWPRVASSPSGFAVVWAEGMDGTGYHIMLRLLDKDGVASGSTHEVSDLCPFAPVPDVAWSGDRYLVVWRADGEGGGDLLGRFVDSTGTVLGAGPVALVTSPALEFQPRVTSASTGFALVWEEQSEAGRGVRRAHVDAQGAVDPPSGVLVASPGDFAADADAGRWGDHAAAVWRVPLPADDDDLFLTDFIPSDTTSSEAIPLTLVRDEAATAVPGRRMKPFLRAFPNPFRTAVWVSQGGSAQEGTLDIFDMAGRRVRRVEAAGAGGWRWDGRTEEGEIAPPGLYFVRRVSGGVTLRLVRLP